MGTYTTDEGRPAPDVPQDADFVRNGLELPFDSELLDDLMERAGLDALVVTSKHNTQYLLGGHRFFFFPERDALGISRYVPVVVYPRGRPQDTCYVGFCNEGDHTEVAPLWVRTVDNSSTGTHDAMRRAAEHLERMGVPVSIIGIEAAFLPAEARDELQGRLPTSRLADSLVLLERLRARKSGRELRTMRLAAERIVESMLDAVALHGEGSTKRQIAESVRRAQTNTGLTFEHCLISVGPDANRAPSGQPWTYGQPLSLDCGGNLDGYIGDLARMAVLGPPDPELVELLEEIDGVQMAARAAVRGGALGRDIYDAAHEALGASPNAEFTSFVAHGMGLVNHEAPRLSDTGPVPYPATDADRPLEAGMVLSIETTLIHPARGLIKLEDTVAVTRGGSEGFGDTARGWISVTGEARGGG